MVRGSENTKSIFELANNTEVWRFIYISNLIVVLMGKQEMETTREEADGIRATLAVVQRIIC